MARIVANNLSPSISVFENDNSQIATTPTGTTVLIAGFSEMGPVEEPTYISSIDEHDSIFGIPTCPATKYSRNAVEQILTTSPGNVLYTRMPFGSGGGLGYSSEYSALVFPVIGVSAVEITPCDFFRTVDETTCSVSFPWLLNAGFVTSAICYGSSNLNCPLNSQDESAGQLYIHNHPVEYDSILTGFKFVVDSDNIAENLKIFQLRPTDNGFNTTYSVVTSINLSSIYSSADEDQSHLSDDGLRLLVDVADSVYASSYLVTAGLLSGQTIHGMLLSAGDVFGTYSVAGSPVLKYFNASSDVAATYATGITTLSSLNAGATFSAVNSAVLATNQDFLISFCATPVEAGLSCDTIIQLGLQVPEDQKYTFYPLDGDAQLADANYYVIGDPISKQLNATEYDLLQNSQFNWKCGVFENVNAALDIANNNVRAGIVVVNEIKSAQLEDFSGYYIALNDNLNINPATDFDSITGVAGYYQEVCPGVSGAWVNVPDDRQNFNVSNTFNGTGGSLSQIVENSAPANFSTPSYNDSLIVSLFQLRPSRLTQTINQLDAVLVEKYSGSLNVDRMTFDANGGPPRTAYLENTINASSNRVSVFINPYLSTNNCWNDASGIPQKTVRMFRAKTAAVFDNFDAQAALQAYSDKLYGVGSYNGACRDALFTLCQKKDIGNLPAKLQRALMGVENPLTYPIDLTVDSGLSTMWATRTAVTGDHCITDPTICYYYDDTYFVDTSALSPFDGTTMTSALEEAWTTIQNVFVDFITTTRQEAGDAGVYHIADPLRQTLVNGKNYKVTKRQKQLKLDPTTGQPTDQYSTFSRNIYTPIKNLLVNVDSSYAECAGNWIQQYDISSDTMGWFGPSSYVAANYCRTDQAAFPWTPSFGIQYGKLTNVADIAINPNQKERDLLAKAGVNAIVKFPEGYIIWNDLTLQKEVSALSSNYIRRGMLWLEKALISSSRQFIGQPNNITTRTRYINKVKPILQYIKDNGGLYDFQVICDASNNTGDSIDNGIINMASYVYWTKATKHLLIEVNVDRTSVSLNTLN